MFNIFMSDIYKLFKSKIFLLCNLACALMVISTGVITYFISKSDSIIADTIQNADLPLELASNPNVISSMGKILANNGDIFLCISIFIAIFINIEFSSGAIKTLSSKGYSRNNLYISKLIACFISTLIIALIAIITRGGVTYILYGFGESSNLLISKALVDISKQLSIYLAITSLFVMIAYIFKKNMISIISTLLLLSLLPQVFYLLRDKLPYTEYIITNAFTRIDDLLISPYLLSIIYIIGTTLIGCLIFKKQDIN